MHSRTYVFILSYNDNFRLDFLAFVRHCIAYELHSPLPAATSSIVITDYSSDLICMKYMH